MRLRSLRLENWLRYDGEHEIALDAEVYAVVGQFDADARRSNWAGKTALLEAVRFALYGVHRASREDEWITNGCAMGAVTVALDDGTRIERRRRRGSATVLTVTMPDGQVAAKKSAQSVIDRLLGLSAADFDATCWIGQKALSKFVLARPAERFEIVSGWVGLDPLQRCEARARLLLSDATTKLSQLDGRIVSAESRISETRHRLGLSATADREEILASLEEETCLARASRAQAEMDRAREEVGAAHARREQARRRVEREGIRTKLGDMRSEFDSLPEVDEARAAARAREAHAGMVAAGADVKSRAALARGEFDGRCPVGGIECPVTERLNAQRARNRDEHKRALTVYDEACRAESLARSDAETAASVERRRAQLLGLREELRARHEALRDGEDLPPGASLEDANEAFSDAAADYRVASDALAAVRSRRAEVEQAFADLARLREHRDLDVRRIAVLRAALTVFGRNGAQRRVAEQALSEIEAGANATLVDAGIDLQVTMQWAREASSGLATSCDACGAPFPASLRVKACDRCGAARGPKMLDRLDVEPSDRSGAAEDLAGAAIQLSAAAWLRRERSVSWSVALIDEPFGALDEANRRAFASSLLRMLRGRFGFEQAFIVAHSPDVMDAMPGRIVVEATEYGSTARIA